MDLDQPPGFRRLVDGAIGAGSAGGAARRHLSDGGIKVAEEVFVGRRVYRIDREVNRRGRLLAIDVPAA